MDNNFKTINDTDIHSTENFTPSPKSTNLLSSSLQLDYNNLKLQFFDKWGLDPKKNIKEQIAEDIVDERNLPKNPDNAIHCFIKSFPIREILLEEINCFNQKIKDSVSPLVILKMNDDLEDHQMVNADVTVTLQQPTISSTIINNWGFEYTEDPDSITWVTNNDRIIQNNIKTINKFHGWNVAVFGTLNYVNHNINQSTVADHENTITEERDREIGVELDNNIIEEEQLDDITFSLMNNTFKRVELNHTFTLPWTDLGINQKIELQFALKTPQPTTPAQLSDFNFVVLIDQHIIYQFTSLCIDQINVTDSYVVYSFDITQFADSKPHILSFRMDTLSYYQGEIFNFYLDNIYIYETLYNLLSYDLFVSTNGDDYGNNGTKSFPFQTIQRAIDYIQDSTTELYTIYVDGGVYNIGLNNTIFNRGKSISIVGMPIDDGDIILTTYPQLTSQDGGFMMVFQPTSIPYLIQSADCPLIPVHLPKSNNNIQYITFNNVTLDFDINSLGCNMISLAQATSLISQSLILSPQSYTESLVCVFALSTFTGSDLRVINGISDGLHRERTFLIREGTVSIDNSYFDLSITFNIFDSNNSTVVVSNSVFSNQGIINSYNDQLLKFTNVSFFNYTDYGMATYFYLEKTITTVLEDIRFINGSNGAISGSSLGSLTMNNISWKNKHLIESFIDLLGVDYLMIKGMAIEEYQDPVRFTSQYFYLDRIQYALLDSITVSSVSEELTEGVFAIFNSHIEFTNLVMRNNSIPLIQASSSTLSLSNIQFINNTLFSLMACTGGGSLEIVNATIMGNRVTAIEASGCILSIQHSLLDSNINTVYDQYPLVYAYNGQLNIAGVQFSNNIGFDVLSLKNVEVAVIDTAQFITNQYGFQISAIDCKVINGSSLTFSGNVEQQPVLSFTNSTINLVRASLFKNVFPANITDCVFTFDNVDISNTTGDSSLNIYSSIGVWKNSRIFNFTISPTDTTLYFKNSDIVFTNVTLDNLSSPGYPIGIMERGSTSFINSTITSTIGSLSGGFKVDNGIFNAISTNFRDNAGKVNAVIFATNSTVYIDDCTVEDNVGSDSIIQIESSTFSILRSNFVKNYLSRTIHFVNSSGVIESSKFKDNTDLTTIVLIERSNISISYTSFVTSFTLNDGSYSTLQLASSQVEILYSSFLNNLGVQRPSIIATGSMLNVYYSCFENNTNLYGIGGDIYMEKSYGKIANNYFKSGGSHIGGCIYMGLSAVEIRNNSFQGCAASLGGSLYIDGSVVNISASSFISGRAEKGDYTDINDIGNLYNGGAIAIASLVGYRSTVWISNSAFTDNSAASDGGALWSSDLKSTINLKTSRFGQNRASGGGGAIFWDVAKKIDSTVHFTENFALYGSNYSTPGKYLELSYPIVQSFIEFPLTCQFKDGYGQLVANHPAYQFALRIVGIQQSNETSYKVALPYMGSYKFYVVLNGASGDEYKANLTLLGKDGQKLFSHEEVLTIFPCQHYQYINDQGICQECPIGMIGYNGISCFKCPDTTTCPDGKMYPNAGYWFSPVFFPPEIYQCDPTVCLDQKCRPLHTGILCGQCVEGASKSLRYCHRCPSDNHATIVLFVIFVVVVIALLIRYDIPTRSVLYSMFVVLQLIGILGEKSSTFSFFAIFNFRIDFLPGCLSEQLNYISKYYIGIAAVFTASFGAIVLSFIPKLRRLLAIPVPANSFRVRLSKRLISIALFFYVPITYLSASLIPCHRVESTWYLIYDQEIECYTREHLTAMIVAIVVIVTFSIIIPLLTLHHRYHSHRTIHPVLFAHIKPSYFFWDFSRLVLCAAFIVAAVSFPPYAGEQTLVFTAFIIIYLGMLILHSPYQSIRRNLFEYSLTFILLLACLVSNSEYIATTNSLGYILISFCTFVMTSTFVYLIKKIRTFKRKEEYQQLQQQQPQSPKHTAQPNTSNNNNQLNNSNGYVKLE